LGCQNPVDREKHIVNQSFKEGEEKVPHRKERLFASPGKKVVKGAEDFSPGGWTFSDGESRKKKLDDY